MQLYIKLVLPHIDVHIGRGGRIVQADVRPVRVQQPRERAGVRQDTGDVASRRDGPKLGPAGPPGWTVSSFQMQSSCTSQMRRQPFYTQLQGS